MIDSVTWIFFSELLVVAMLWVFILEFNSGFNNQEDLEKIITYKILTNPSKPPCDESL
jgi:hypothetical protein